MLTLEAVSYTHLEVYKRQEYALPVAGLLFSISSLVGNAYNPFLYYQF